MTQTKNRLLEIAEQNGWKVTISKENNRKYKFYDILLSRYSSKGQDFNINLQPEKLNDKSLIKELREETKNFDCSYETYIWLDETGHGRRGAPYEMIDVYNDMQECLERMKSLLECWKDSLDPHHSDKNIGANLTYLREKYGTDTKHIARFLYINEMEYIGFEAGTFSASIEHLEKLADLYCIDAYDLMQEKKPQPIVVTASFIPEGDYKAMADFHRMVKNYLKMQKIENKK